jgi:uncharacterized protein YkwD
MSVNALRRALLAACLIVCALPPSGAVASARHDRTETKIIRAMNGARAGHGLPRLRPSHRLARAADAHSAAMARTNTLGHGAFTARVRRYVNSRWIGENLAWLPVCNAGRVVRMWLRSTAHRRIMLSRAFQRVGVARRSGSGACFVTADFASLR